jgi:hypothetical protein
LNVVFYENNTRIACFPVKEYWKETEKIEHISHSLKKLRKLAEEHGIKSICIPQLLQESSIPYAYVNELIRDIFYESDIDVIICQNPA